jgi:hypothetical protein
MPKPMSRLSTDQIRSIAEELEIGMRCICHRKTSELIFIPDEERFPSTDLETRESDIRKVNSKRSHFLEIRPMQSRDSFEVMNDFTEGLPERSELRRELQLALARKNPFANFNSVIHNQTLERQAWFEFKTNQMLEWVKAQLEIAG